MSTPFSEQLRHAVNESPMSRYRIAQLTGIAESTLSLFVRGERGLSLDSIDRLMEVLKLEIKSTKRKGT
jgi:transcriptional regulator with XRE-family HTH domain